MITFLPLIVVLPRMLYDLEWGPGYTRFIGPMQHPRRTTFAALQGSRVVGVLITGFDRRTRTLHSYGTLVMPALRKRRLAEQLWRKAIRTTRPRSVTVAVVSDRGRTLIEALMAQHPRILWNVLEAGDRRLRNLKGRAA